MGFAKILYGEQQLVLTRLKERLRRVERERIYGMYIQKRQGIYTMDIRGISPVTTTTGLEKMLHL